MIWRYKKYVVGYYLRLYLMKLVTEKHVKPTYHGRPLAVTRSKEHWIENLFVLMVGFTLNNSFQAELSSF